MTKTNATGAVTYANRASAVRGAERAGLDVKTLFFDKGDDGRWTYRKTTEYSAKGALTLIWNWLWLHRDTEGGLKRSAVIAALVERGMNPGTVSTQFQKWRHASEDERKARAGL